MLRCACNIQKIKARERQKIYTPDERESERESESGEREPAAVQFDSKILPAIQIIRERERQREKMHKQD